MGVYLHIWHKNGILTRFPYLDIETAEKEAWEWERAENARLKPLNDFSLPGAHRDQMITVITDENNEILPVDFFGRSFMWDLGHNDHIYNENYWAFRLEAASRDLVLGKIYCDPEMCYNCKNQIDAHGKSMVTGKSLLTNEDFYPFGETDTIVRPSTRRQRVGHGYAFLPTVTKSTESITLRLTPAEKIERDAWIHGAHARKMPIAEIAYEVGLSQARVYEILRKYQ